MYRAVDAARYIVNEAIRQDKPAAAYQVHGLLIIAQASSLLANDRPLFLERIIRGKYFPHVEDVPMVFANQYCGHMTEPVKTYEELVFEDPFRVRVDVISFDEGIFSEEDKRIMNEVVRSYSNLFGPALKKEIYKYDELAPVMESTETPLSCS